ncbi:hypothetical protein QJS10_CPB17g02484 [Acorus calamus]|uniref:Legume lectin domain-containing protein n=1 Tax=Acorus calamus TaxID=4465 RepID=A0AAV9CW40_ACOCL|nr:hypothetical protein QJS10_CPB17g02484 [Acorus calamus]
MTNATINSPTPFVAIEFDTFLNEWDPNYNHIGIDINAMKSLVDVPWDYMLNGTNVANAWVVYNASLQKLSVFATYDQNLTFNGSNSILSYNVDLRKVLPASIYVGFSATTGTAVEFHNIRTWAFDSTLDVAAASDPVPQIRRRSRFVRNVGVIVGVVVAAVALGVLWRAIDFQAGEGKAELVKWVWQLYGTGELAEAADEKLGREFDEGELKRLMIVGLWCAHPDYASRPSIRQAISALKSEVPLPELPLNMPVPIFVASPPVAGQSLNSYGATSLFGSATDSAPMLAFSHNNAHGEICSYGEALLGTLC